MNPEGVGRTEPPEPPLGEGEVHQAQTAPSEDAARTAERKRFAEGAGESQAPAGAPRPALAAAGRKAWG